MRLLLGASLALFLSACADLSPQEKLNRIAFLNKHNKETEALQFAKEAYRTEKGDDRSRILMAGAEVAFHLFKSTQQKSYLKEMFELLNVVINEKLPAAPYAYFAVAQAYLDMGNDDKAMEFYISASKIAPTEQEAAGYYHEIIGIFWRRKDYRRVIRESEYMEKKFPKYDKLDRVEAFRGMAVEALKLKGEY